MRQTVAASWPGELDTIRKKALVRKLGLNDGAELMDDLHRIIDIYGTPNRDTYRAVIYHMLAGHSGRESICR